MEEIKGLEARDIGMDILKHVKRQPAPFVKDCWAKGTVCVTCNRVSGGTYYGVMAPIFLKVKLGKFLKICIFSR